MPLGLSFDHCDFPLTPIVLTVGLFMTLRRTVVVLRIVYCAILLRPSGLA